MRNKSKRKWSWRIAAFMVFTGLLLMTGCVSEIPVSETEQEEMQKIIVGSDRYEPYIYLDEEGKFSGIDVELATEAFHRMGYEPEFQEILWENKKDALTDGTVDCLWGCFSMNGREDEYQWAGPYLYSSQVVVVREDSEIQTVSDLTGKRIICCS